MVPMSASDGSQMPRWLDILGFAQHAEQLAFDSLWVCDHFISDPGDKPIEGIHEAWTILSALAVSTTRVELGQLVMCASFRSPGLLAKMAATADAVSGGRLLLGLGAGSYDAEFKAFGYPTDHRASRLEEAIQILNELLDGQRVTFNGRFHLKMLSCSPGLRGGFRSSSLVTVRGCSRSPPSTPVHGTRLGSGRPTTDCASDSTNSQLRCAQMVATQRRCDVLSASGSRIRRSCRSIAAIRKPSAARWTTFPCCFRLMTDSPSTT